MSFLLSPDPQGSLEWFKIRAGRVTSSKVECVFAQGKTKGAEAVTRRNYRVQLVTERLTGEPQEDSYQSRDMLAGKENEPYARMAYEAQTGAFVEEAGFAYLADLATGASVDGFILEDPEGSGVLEAKCPKSATHIAYMQANRLPPEYIHQVTHEVWITEADFADFISFDPRLPGKLRLFRVRVYRNELELKKHEAGVRLFLAEVDELEDQLRRRAAA